MNRFLLLLLLCLPVCATAQRYKEQLTFTATGDQTMPLGRYQIGGSVRIECQISGGWAEDGGIYHVVGDWSTKPKVIYRGESSISARLKFFGYVDPIHPGYSFLFATWDNQAPGETYVNAVKLTIYSEASIDVNNHGAFNNATELESVLNVQSHTGNVGIGTSAPTGKLHVAGGNASGSVPSLIIGGGVSGENINDLYILDSKSNNNGVGFAARVIGINIQPQTDPSNKVIQRSIWGGVTGASAVYLGADDVYQGQFGILTSPQGSAAGTVLTERFTVKGNGNVGIGTASPGAKLEVSGAMNTAALILGNENLIAFKRSDGALVYGMGHSSGEFTIGKTPFLGSTAGTPINIASGGAYIKLTQGEYERMRIANNGNVGIGTVSPDSKLTVKGAIHAEEVKVDLNVPGPDYVFEADYPLASLEDTKAYIDQHKHLPGIPSSAEMQQNGVNLLEMNMKLLEKVEEMTLYLIEMKAENIMIKDELEQLKRRVSTIKE